MGIGVGRSDFDVMPQHYSYLAAPDVQSCVVHRCSITNSDELGRRVWSWLNQRERWEEEQEGITAVNCWRSNSKRSFRFERWRRASNSKRSYNANRKGEGEGERGRDSVKMQAKNLLVGWTKVVSYFALIQN